MGDSWDKVWNALQSPTATIPSVAQQEGPPVRVGTQVVFRFRAPQGTTKVYLAGSFNNFADNKEGAVTDERFAMTPLGNDLWFKKIPVEAKVEKYKFVVVGQDGRFNWVSDPHVPYVDGDGNSVVDFSTIAHQNSVPPLMNLRALKPFQPLFPSLTGEKSLTPRLQNVWCRPDQANTLLVTLSENEVQADSRLRLEILTPFGQSVYTSLAPAHGGENRLAIPALGREGGFVAQVTLTSAEGRKQSWGETVLSVVQNVADDLRYGFYASYGKLGENYDTKAGMLAELGINAVEFYDYFPAHGYYAPREADYKFEPFGIQINARDVQRKIEAGHRRNMLSLAYVASYAASDSVYRAHPFPMTDAAGVPKVFNGSIMTEAEADRQNKAKWFYLMNIAPDSPWHRYILEEFGRTLDDSPNDLVSFDGFELDTYGDNTDSKFYAQGSARSGDLLTNVLHDFVGDVQKETHRIKPHGLVSFNSVNEFGVQKMVDVTDFLFLEIWDFYTPNLENIVDICSRNRAARQQRVILKLYPATMQQGQKVWPEATLRRLLGATMTGAGSLMVAGEPDEQSGQMHALNTLYYPDHQPIPKANEKLLHDYYHFDALMYGWTHGKSVQNTALENEMPDCVTRTYAIPAKKALVMQLLNVQNERKWTVDTPAFPPRKNLDVVLDLPAGATPQTVLFATPDVSTFAKPVQLDFEVTNGKLHTQLPELDNYGVVILRY
ncbi:hypothetical protein IAD21_06303 [Abditibacteriota bacterium]|nr:hypothetical protein IAD21_06303 [Abditibacteriota bacterium]